MKNALPPITVKQVRQIIRALGDQYKVPSDDALAELAAVLTGHQYCNVLPEEELEGFPRRVQDALGNEYVIKAPLLPDPPPVDWQGPGRISEQAQDKRTLGHPRHFERTWHDLAPDMAAAFHKAMGRKLGKRAATARFLEKVIPLVTGETPSVHTIGRELMSPRQRKRLKPLG